MFSDPHTWAALLNWCADITGEFLRAQIEAGASAAQLFDSWVGSLSEVNYLRRVAPHSRRAISTEAALRLLAVLTWTDSPLDGGIRGALAIRPCPGCRRRPGKTVRFV